LGAAVSVALGVYGAQHTPTGESISTFGFESLIAMKVWLAFVAGGLGLVQLLTALWMYGVLRVDAPAWTGVFHRVTGSAAVLVSLPVAYHCLWSFGYQSYDNRVLLHSLTGCAFYGAVVTKVVAVQRRSLPGWLLPLAGGLLFTTLVLVVYTSAVWYVREIGWPAAGGGY
jgi:hypothetical protein